MQQNITHQIKQNQKRHAGVFSYNSRLLHFTLDAYLILLSVKQGGGGACGVMVIIVGNGHSDTSSNPGRG